MWQDSNQFPLNFHTFQAGYSDLLKTKVLSLKKISFKRADWHHHRQQADTSVVLLSNLSKEPLAPVLPGPDLTLTLQTAFIISA